MSLEAIDELAVILNFMSVEVKVLVEVYELHFETYFSSAGY